MGYSLAWIGVKDVNPHSMLQALALAGTGRRETLPESPLTGVDLANGWYLVIANHQSDEFFADAILKRLSIEGEVVTCFLEEHVMFSRAAGWSGGRKVWWVLHDAERDIEHLEAGGELPACFAAVRDRLRSSQEAAGGRDADVDYTFSVPIELAQALTGFRHDLDPPNLGERPFEILAKSR